MTRNKPGHTQPNLTHLDTLALIAVARIGDDAYGVSVRDEIASVTGREVSMAAVYAALDRLDRLGLVEPWRSEPRAERGGRSRRHYRLSPAGREALRHERELQIRLWRGLVIDDQMRS